MSDKQGTPTQVPPLAGTPSNGSGHMPPPGDPQPRRGPGAPLVTLLALVLGFAGGVAGNYAADRLGGDDGSSRSPVFDESLSPTNEGTDGDEGAARSDGDEGELTPREIYKRVSPAVVHVNARIRVAETSIFGFPQEREGVGSGSGFVIDRKGHIVTNAHVVAHESGQQAESVSVSFSDEREYKAEIVGTDFSTDVAVLKVDADSDELRRALKPVPFGDSGRVQVGDQVLAIGNPFNLDRTLTTGVVSALQRQLRAPNGFAIDDVIQTDAAINPGNSGGPLLNVRGEVIGINSQIQSRSGGNQGIGFAVPSNTVRRVVNQLVEHGAVKHAWLGVSGTDITPAVSDLLRLPSKSGVLVNVVTDGSPADKAGIEGGDRELAIDGMSFRIGGSVITEIDGRKLETMRDLADYINQKQPGDTVEIEFFDGDDRKTERIRLGTRPDELADER